MHEKLLEKKETLHFLFVLFFFLVCVNLEYEILILVFVRENISLLSNETAQQQKKESTTFTNENCVKKKKKQPDITEHYICSFVLGITIIIE